VDGNVLRVVSRLLDDATPIDLPAQKKKIRDVLQEIYPAQAGDFTQALMELGATVCGPNKKPDCEHCPCKELCLGYARGTAEQLPVKSPKRARRTEEKTVFIFRCDGKYALKKRETTGLLAGLWQFPDVPGKLTLEQALDAARSFDLKIMDVRRQLERSHIFTHIQWQMRGFFVEVAEPAGEFAWMTEETVESEAALPTAFRQFWEERNHV
jgi:A/G-specific adenine glycosylase